MYIRNYVYIYNTYAYNTGVYTGEPKVALYMLTIVYTSTFEVA